MVFDTDAGAAARGCCPGMPPGLTFYLAFIGANLQLQTCSYLLRTKLWQPMVQIHSDFLV